MGPYSEWVITTRSIARVQAPATERQRAPSQC